MKCISQFFILTYFLFSFSSNAQWSPTDGPYSSVEVVGLKEHNSVLYAGTHCGLFVRPVAGGRWQRISDFFVPKLYVYGDSLFASFYHGLGILDLDDPGFNLHTQPYVSGTPFVNGPSIAFKDSLMFIASSDGLHVSTDTGASTQIYTQGLEMDTNIYGGNTYISINMTDVITTPQYLYISTNNGIFRSDYTLSGWEKKSAGINGSLIRQLYSYGGDLYARAYDSLYISQDDGDSWSAIYGGNMVMDMCYNNNELYVATNGLGIMKSSDGGTSWQSFHAGIRGKPVQGLESTPNGFYCMVAGEGIYKWDGSQWQNESYAGMYCTNLSGLQSTATDVVTSDWRGVFRLKSDDTWEDVSPRQNSNGIYGSLVSYRDTLFVPAFSYASGSMSQDSLKVFVSNDNATSWQSSAMPLFFPNNITEIKLRYFNGVLYAFDEEVLYSSENLGQSWTNISPANVTCWRAIRDLVYFDGEIYLATCITNNLLRYDNSLGRWITDPVPLFNGRDLESFMVRDSALFVHAFDAVYRRYRGGNAWQRADNGLIPSYVTGYINVNQHLFLSIHNGVYYTDDNGDNWHALNAGLPPSAGMGIGVLNDTLYLATGWHGVYKHMVPALPVSLVEVREKQYDVKVFPNPASESCSISLPDEKGGNFKIVDQGGKILREGEFKSGEAINLHHLPGGLFMVLIESEGKSFRKKLVIQE